MLQDQVSRSSHDELKKLDPLIVRPAGRSAPHGSTVTAQHLCTTRCEECDLKSPLQLEERVNEHKERNRGLYNM
jgi:hypothetical protein